MKRAKAIEVITSVQETLTTVQAALKQTPDTACIDFAICNSILSTSAALAEVAKIEPEVKP